MTITRGLRLVAAGLLTMLMFSSCSNGTGGNSTPTPSSPSPRASATPTPSSSPTPTPSSAGEQAAADAVVSYIRMVDRLGADPQADLVALLDVARGDALAQMQYTLSSYRGQGWRVIGESRASFAGSFPGSDATQWLVSMCIDVSQVDVLDTNGVSVQNPDGPTSVLTEFVVDRDSGSEKWFVTKEEAKSEC